MVPLTFRPVRAVTFTLALLVLVDTLPSVSVPRPSRNTELGCVTLPTTAFCCAVLVLSAN
jgi:hypothetical protein